MTAKIYSKPEDVKGNYIGYIMVSSKQGVGDALNRFIIHLLGNIKDKPNEELYRMVGRIINGHTALIAGSNKYPLVKPIVVGWDPKGLVEVWKKTSLKEKIGSSPDLLGQTSNNQRLKNLANQLVIVSGAYDSKVYKLGMDPVAGKWGWDDGMGNDPSQNYILMGEVSDDLYKAFKEKLTGLIDAENFGLESNWNQINFKYCFGPGIHNWGSLLHDKLKTGFTDMAEVTDINANCGFAAQMILVNFLHNKQILQLHQDVKVAKGFSILMEHFMICEDTFNFGQGQHMQMAHWLAPKNPMPKL